MDGLQALISIGLGIVAIFTLAGLGLLRGTVTGLRESLDDERKTSASLRTQREEDRTKIAQLQTDLAALGRVVTGEAHWIAIGDALAEHNTRAAAHWTTEQGLLSEIRDELRELGTRR